MSEVIKNSINEIQDGDNRRRSLKPLLENKIEQPRTNIGSLEWHNRGSEIYTLQEKGGQTGEERRSEAETQLWKVTHCLTRIQKRKLGRNQGTG